MTRQARVLVVEDEALVARDLVHTLVEMGYVVTGCAASGEDAVRAASRDTPDVVLMDIRLRGVMDGVEAARVMRDMFQLPVIFVTAHADDQTVARASLADPYSYVIKPFTAREIRSAIEITLRRALKDGERDDRERWVMAGLRAIDEGVMGVDVSGRVTCMNPVAERLTGWTEGDARGHLQTEVLKLETDATDSLAPTTRVLVRGTAERHPVLVAHASIEREGHVLGTLTLLRDLREQALLQERLALAENLASLGTLAASVAHEINNPLAYNLANVEYALTLLGAEALDPGDPWTADRLHRIVDALHDAREGSMRVAKIVSELRKVQRPVEEVHRVVDVPAAIDWALKLVQNKIRHVAKVVRDLHPVPGVLGSDARLSQVFVNLLVNAAEAIRGRPEVNEVRVSTRLVDRKVVVEVRDTGPGIAPEALGSIFEPFFTTKQTGSGLGLAICQRIVRGFGGELTVTSVVGEGSTFRVELPVARTTAAPAEPLVTAAPRTGGTLLVVDDEPLLRAAIVRKLEDARYAVTSVDSAGAALTILRDRGPVDLILCDVMMPEMTGIDLYETLLVENPVMARRMAFMTGGAFTARADEFLASVERPRIEKPFNAEMLLNLVSQCVAAARSE